jgi:CTP synthase
MREANSTENVNLCTQPVVIDMPEHSTGKMGGTMRLGRKATIFDTSKTDSVLRKLMIRLKAAAFMRMTEFNE